MWKTLCTLENAGFLENIQESCQFLLLDRPVLLLVSRVDFHKISRVLHQPLPPLSPDNHEPLPYIHRSASEIIATAGSICPQPEGFLCSVSHSSILLRTDLQNLTIHYLHSSVRAEQAVQCWRQLPFLLPLSVPANLGS